MESEDFEFEDVESEDIETEDLEFEDTESEDIATLLLAMYHTMMKYIDPDIVGKYMGKLLKKQFCFLSEDNLFASFCGHLFFAVGYFVPILF